MNFRTENDRRVLSVTLRMSMDDIEFLSKLHAEESDLVHRFLGERMWISITRCMSEKEGV